MITAALSLTSACCFGGDDPPPPPAPTPAASVQMPTALEALDDFARAHGGTARVETVHEYGSGGGGSCGHSLLCILVLPAVFIAPFIPHDHQLATVEADGVAIYQGRFGMDGAFIQARVREGDVYVDAERLSLPALGRDYVVVTYRTPVGAPIEERVRVPLRDQLDLVTAYRSALASDPSPDALVDEAREMLGADAALLVVEQIEHAPRPMPYPASRVAAACDDVLRPTLPNAISDALRAPGPLRERLVAALVGRDDDPAARPLLACLEPSAEPAPSLASFVRGAARDGWVRGYPGGVALAERLELAPDLLAAARDETERGCHDAGFRLAFGLDAPEGEIATVLAGPHRGMVARHLDPSVPSHRHGLFAALTADVCATAHRLVSAQIVPTPSELDAIVAALSAPGALATRGVVDLLRLFAAAPRADRRRALDAAPTIRPELAPVLALLAGERGRLGAIAAAASADAAASFELVPTSAHPADPMDVFDPSCGDADEDHVPYFALWLAGCSMATLHDVPRSGWAAACDDAVVPRWELTLVALPD